MNRIFKNFCCLGSKYVSSSDENRRKDDDVSTKNDRLNDNSIDVKIGIDSDDKNGNSTEISRLTYKVGFRFCILLFRIH